VVEAVRSGWADAGISVLLVSEEAGTKQDYLKPMNRPLLTVAQEPGRKETKTFCSFKTRTFLFLLYSLRPSRLCGSMV